MNEPFAQAHYLRDSVRWILMLLHFMGLLALIVLIASKGEAKTVSFGSVPEQVKIKFGGATVFRFQKPVQTITGANRLQIKPASDTDPSYNVLAVTPHFTNGNNDVSFFLTDGSVIKTRIIVTSKDDNGMDSVYDFKPKLGDGTSDDAAPKLSEVELLKAMVNDAQVSGYQISKSSETIPSKESGVSIELIRTYKGSQFNGYVFTVTNKNWLKKFHLEIQQITVGHADLAILSQADELDLYPKGKGVHQTLMRIVTKSTASLRDLIVPMEPDPVKPDKKNHKTKDSPEES